MEFRRQASATIYVQEELSDARLRCDQLKNMVAKALNLINDSDESEYLYAAAGDLIYGIPDALLRMEKALDAAALAVDKIDYEEIRQTLRPEKVDELERVLDEVRLRIPRRTGGK